MSSKWLLQGVGKAGMGRPWEPSRDLPHHQHCPFLAAPQGRGIPCSSRRDSPTPAQLQTPLLLSRDASGPKNHLKRQILSKTFQGRSGSAPPALQGFLQLLTWPPQGSQTQSALEQGPAWSGVGTGDAAAKLGSISCPHQGSCSASCPSLSSSLCSQPAGESHWAVRSQDDLGRHPDKRTRLRRGRVRGPGCSKEGPGGPSGQGACRELLGAHLRGKECS